MDTQDIRARYFPRITAYDPSLDLADAVINEDGLVNIAIIVGERVFRFARNDAAIEALRHERAVLDLLSGRTALTIPKYQPIDDDCVTYRLIPGEALFRHDLLRLPEARQQALANALCAFLRSMHTIPAEDVRARGIGASGGRQTHADWLSLYEEIQRELFPLMYRSTQTWVYAQFAPIVDDVHFLDHTPVLIHDDLAQYHILFDRASGRLNGVIDFGSAGLGDPARDYGILINVYGESFVRRMLDTDPALPTLLDRARFYHNTFELQWLLGGVRTNNFEWCTAALDRARDVLPYGSG